MTTVADGVDQYGHGSLVAGLIGGDGRRSGGKGARAGGDPMTGPRQRVR